MGRGFGSCRISSPYSCVSSVGGGPDEAASLSETDGPLAGNCAGDSDDSGTPRVSGIAGCFPLAFAESEEDDDAW